MPALDPAWIALIGTLCGGLGLKLLEHFLGRAKEKATEATQMRDELRGEITSQKAEIAGLELQLSELREKYFDLREKHGELMAKYTISLAQIKGETVETNRPVHAIDQGPQN